MWNKLITIVALCVFQLNLMAQNEELPTNQKPTDKILNMKQVKSAAKKQKKQDNRRQILFPDWKQPGFGVLLNLQGGRVGTSNFSGESISKNSILEVNGIAGLRNLPIFPGNPGLYVSPEVAYGKGFRFTDGFDTEQYSRWWYGSGVTALNGPIKATIGLHQGIVNWDTSSIPDSKVIQGNINLGLKVIPLLNVHNDMTMRVYYSDSFDDPTFREFDNWTYAHAKMKPFNLSIKAGPGYKYLTYYNPAGKTKGSLTYGKIQGAADIFWKLGMDMYGNYVFNDSLSGLPAQSVSDQLPLQTSSTGAEEVILPRDTLDYTFFIGARNLVDGLTVGWKYNIRILNALERDGDKQISKESGIHFSYSLNVNGV